MRVLLLLCAILLIIALGDLPIGYYTFLRIIVTVGASLIVIKELNKGVNFWVVIFIIVAILFNPLIPVYLGDKEAWIPIDIVSAVLFLIKCFVPDNDEK